MSSQLKKTCTVSSAQVMFGDIVKWITIISCIIALAAPVFILAKPESNLMNPNHIFSLIFSGESTDAVWEKAASGFPGGHFYLQSFFTGDGFAQFGIALGCSVALWALIPTIIEYVKSKEYIYVFICIFISFLIILAMTGLVKL